MLRAKKADWLKLLYWDGTGLVMAYKRLEEHTFTWTEATVAHVLVSKYADHLPLYRQAQIYSRQGVDLDRSTLADWVGLHIFRASPTRLHSVISSIGSGPNLRRRKGGNFGRRNGISFACRLTENPEISNHADQPTQAFEFDDVRG